MTTDDVTAFLQRLEALAEMYDAKFSETKQMLYFAALEDLPFDEVVRALNIALRTCKFMPRPSELRELVTDSTDDAAELAWLEYKRIARVDGAYRSPTVDAALADTLIAVFGSWESACWTELSPEMWASKRKEFGRVYRVLANRGTHGPAQLTGFCDRKNLELRPQLQLSAPDTPAQITTTEASDGTSMAQLDIPALLRTLRKTPSD